MEGSPDCVREPGADPQQHFRADRPRIFGIGLNKTGTTSLDRAMTMLGFESLHDGGPDVHDAVRRAIDDGEPLLSNLDQRFDVFSDIGLLARRFRLLDAQYPGSRFVFTTRPMDQWIDSRRRHVERNVALHEAGEYDRGFLVVDVEKWTREWKHHTQRVHAYFEGRPDFLEIDLTANPEWGVLCRFLGVAEPDEPFPWANRDKALHVHEPDAR
jgi:hypothetical protein